MIDLSATYNPYDFANPVSDSSLFFGRQTEMTEIRYYLDLAKAAPRPINIALLGARASGKTSILNMTELAAQERGFCAVRVNLDEGDAQTQLRFFQKVLDAIFFKACELGAFGGINGRTFETYLELVTTYAVPTAVEFMPLLFPIQYARAMGVGNDELSVSDNSYAHDLKALRTAAERPVIILFDEGNVLANSRVHLEKLRNIFMNLPGYMLVITGTPDLFPVMDEVFSPMVRQFKKIPVVEFKKRSETESCVKEPLRKLGLRERDIDQMVGRRNVDEIHELSGGRPYEIQLVCHTLFRRIQQRRARVMSLDVGVLDEVRQELETSQSLTKRPILEMVRSLDGHELRGLLWLLEGAGQASFEELWALEFIFHGTNRWNRDDLLGILSQLSAKGILHQEDGDLLRFRGDEFERIYTRFLGRERGFRSGHMALTPSLLAQVRLFETFEREDISTLPASEGITPERLVALLKSPSEGADVFVEYPFQAQQLYLQMMRCQSILNMPYASVELDAASFRVGILCFPNDPDAIAELDHAIDTVDVLSERAAQVDSRLSVQRSELEVVSIEILKKRLEMSANESIRSMIAELHAAEMVSAYLEHKDVNAALLNAQLAADYGSGLRPGSCNNIGYVLMAAGRIEEAKIWFERATAEYAKAEKVEGVGSELPKYNLALVAAAMHGFQEARTILQDCVADLEGKNEDERTCGCLFLPQLEDGKIRFEEIRGDERGQVDLLPTAREALTRIEDLLGPSSAV